MGSTLFFLKNYWDIVGPSFTLFCTKIFFEKTIPREINTTHVCLIPKTPNASTLK